jgi:hypothetical protein
LTPATVYVAGPALAELVVQLDVLPAQFVQT